MNYFYYSQNPYVRNFPQSFYSFSNQFIKNPVRNGLNFNSLITSAQKGINTINQIIPLYKQIKPIYSQAKNSFASLKKYIRFPSNNNINRNSKTNYSSSQTNSNYTFKYSNNGPSEPFY